MISLFIVAANWTSFECFFIFFRAFWSKIPSRIPIHPLAILINPNGIVVTAPNPVTKLPAVQVTDMTDEELAAN